MVVILGPIPPHALPFLLRSSIYSMNVVNTNTIATGDDDGVIKVGS